MSKAQRGSSIATTTNVAYETIKLGRQECHDYEMIDMSECTNHSLIDGNNKIPPSHQLHPTIPHTVAPPTSRNVGVARERVQEVVYATVPGDQ